VVADPEPVVAAELGPKAGSQTPKQDERIRSRLKDFFPDPETGEGNAKMPVKLNCQSPGSPITTTIYECVPIPSLYITVKVESSYPNVKEPWKEFVLPLEIHLGPPTSRRCEWCGSSRCQHGPLMTSPSLCMECIHYWFSSSKPLGPNKWAKFALFLAARKLEEFSLTAVLRRQVVASHVNFVEFYGGDISTFL
jgi:hypothetical protein